MRVKSRLAIVVFLLLVGLTLMGVVSGSFDASYETVDATTADSHVASSDIYHHIYVYNENATGGSAIYIKPSNGASTLTSGNKTTAIRVMAQGIYDKDIICERVYILSDSGTSTYSFVGYIPYQE